MSLINSSLYDQRPLCGAKGSMSQAPAHGTVCYFQGAQLCKKTLKMGLEHGSIYIF